ncbi:hypothetical protein KL86SPO_70567 [uncultured Sporomusa sp.]|uniref:Uncharacterized protein n=1 Tax=uncultured Sporomusa sp. TaxID=307249 RepID=A0A212M215_9FIRM|nr:hypothetical protein KL86SPO_70567 [uncultured Sporomusa sp.]
MKNALIICNDIMILMHEKLL